jgi:hypothetical protein
MNQIPPSTPSEHKDLLELDTMQMGTRQCITLDSTLASISYHFYRQHTGKSDSSQLRRCQLHVSAQLLYSSYPSLPKQFPDVDNRALFFSYPPTRCGTNSVLAHCTTVLACTAATAGGAGWDDP